MMEEDVGSLQDYDKSLRYSLAEPAVISHTWYAKPDSSYCPPAVYSRSREVVIPFSE
jgi:hypothetical protein